MNRFLLTFYKGIFPLLLLISILFAAGCATSDEGDAPYLNVFPLSLTFNAESPNEVTVESNGTWSVTTRSSALRVDKTRGSGDAVIRVTDAPVGESTLTVAMGTVSHDVTVTRVADGEETVLSLSPETFDYSSDDPAANVVSVKCNTSWKASAKDSRLQFAPAEGTGDGTVTITGGPEGEDAVLSVTAGEGTNAVTKTTKIVFPVIKQEAVVYSDDFDKAAVAGSVWADQNATSWPNPTGEGGATVTYEGSQVQVRNDSYGSAAVGSGRNYVRLYYEGKPDPVFLVKNISLPAGETAFTLSMSASFTAADCALDLSPDGLVWARLNDVPGVPVYNRWGTFSIGFTLTEPAEKLFIRFTPLGPKQNFGINFDDLKLTAGGGGQAISFEKKSYRWAELPTEAVSAGDYVVHTFWSETVSSHQHLRNYTYCYDTRLHCPLWIAHPQHACYQEGGLTRPDTDPWAADPNMTNDEQSIIYPLEPGAGSNAWITVPYMSESYRQWGRGHMLASSYRGCGDKYNPAEINVQTFYSCNIAPQKGVAFDKLWQQAEFKVYDYYVCADTLYCISGAYFENEHTKTMDASWYSKNAEQVYHRTGYAKECAVPTHYYKLVLRTKSGNTGRSVQECSADELKAVGFWFTHADTDPVSGSQSPVLDSRYLKSVAEIEALTGFTFFPDVPQSVKEQCNPSDWGL